MSSLPAGPAAPRQGSAGAPADGGEVARALAVCPLLRSADGSWTSVHASRELRCWAVEPPFQPAVPKQRALCASARHDECATYRAAQDAEVALGTDDRSPSLLWPAAAVPVALEPAGWRASGIGPGRSVSQALLVGLMVVAFAVLLLSRAGPLGGGGAATLPPASEAAMSSAGAVASPSAVPSPSGSPSASPIPSPSATAAAQTPSPTASPSPIASQRTYKVRSGDTLAGIAATFHSTVKAIVTANNIADPRTIHPGQVLIIP